jgi:hypothetical protein
MNRKVKDHYEFRTHSPFEVQQIHKIWSVSNSKSALTVIIPI